MPYFSVKLSYRLFSSACFWVMVLIRNRFFHLKVDQFLHTITQFHKTFDACFGGGVEIGRTMRLFSRK